MARAYWLLSAFVANIYFWRDTDYFSLDAGEKPLLHLWSLGVEEQFYIIFPLLLLVVARYWSKLALASVTALTAGSLLINMMAFHIGADSPAFFLLPSRAWELGIGAGLAMLPARSYSRPKWADVAAAMGALLLIAGVAHPVRLYGIVPEAIFAVSGTALLIYAGECYSPQGTLPVVNRLLSMPILVFFGLISYSLYLWHWPILVFTRYYLVRELSPSELIAASLLMCLCATLSWRFIERPFRNRNMPRYVVVSAVSAALATFVVGALVLIGAHGFPARLNAAAAVMNESVGNNYRCPVSQYLKLGGSRACQMNLPSRNPADADIVLIGNSHAQMYAPAWEAILSERGDTGLLVPLNGCLPTVQANISPACLEAAARNLTAVSNLPHVKTVVIGLTWYQRNGELVDAKNRSLDSTEDKALISAIDDLIDRFRALGKRVILIGPIAEPGYDVASVVSRQLAFGHPLDRPPYMPAAEFYGRFNAVISHFSARNDIEFVRPDTVQCSESRCNYFIDGHALFSDNNHVASNEVQRFKPIFSASLAAERTSDR